MWNFSSSVLVVHLIIKIFKVKRVTELARVFDSVSPDANSAVGRDTRNVNSHHYKMAYCCQHFRLNDWHLLQMRSDKRSFHQEAATEFPTIT